MWVKSSLFSVVLFLACWFSLPDTTVAHKHHNNHQLETLLTAGVLAKVLQKKGGGHHHHPIFIPIPVPVHHHEEHHHKGHHHHHGTNLMPVMAYGGHPMASGRHAMGPGPGYNSMGGGQSSSHYNSMGGGQSSSHYSSMGHDSPLGHDFEPKHSVQIINIGGGKN